MGSSAPESNEQKGRTMEKEKLVPIGELGIGAVVMWLRAECSAYREGWNGKKQSIRLQVPDENSKMTEPYVYMEIQREDGLTVRIPWLCSQADLLATDWVVMFPAGDPV